MIKKVCIVGGGSSGWMSAAYLSLIDNLEVTLIESPTIPIIGVGESCIPSIVDFLETIGINEKDLFDECSAVRKYGIIHKNWNGDGKEWHHMFVTDGEIDLAEQYDWMKNYVYPNKHWRHSYHLDATKLSTLIKIKAGQKVNHVYDDIIKVNTDNHNITSLEGKLGTYKADLYIDCTGFKAVLRNSLPYVINKHKNFKNDFAWAGPGHYREGEAPLPYTETFSMDHGWRWRVCLQHRTGNGYAFSSDTISIEDAKKEFISKTDGLNVEKIFLVKMINGYNPEPWKGNTIAIGLSCGFLEPLEATGLFLTYGMLSVIKRVMFTKNASRKYNMIWNTTYKDISKFLSYFYTGSKLNHTSYWKSFEKTESLEVPEKSAMLLFNEYNYQMLAKGMEVEAL
jgi:tryptophan halogenase